MSRLSSRLLHGAIRFYPRWEKLALCSLGLAFLGSCSFLLVRFYRESTVMVPSIGGTYIEGSIGDLQPLIPWFVVTNDVNRDVISLVFSGLLRYNPQTRKIDDDLATMKVSGDGTVYTLTLRPNLFWHDSTEKKPHPVTADDVLFTFQSIQNPKFPNALLHQNFRGVTLEKLNDRTVQFRLDRPYSFFPSNLTLGLVPRASFEGVPIESLDQVLDFGFQPVGAGPYKLKSIVQTDLSTEVTLERFPRDLSPIYRLDSIVLRMFPDFTSLLSDLRNLDGIRAVPHTDKGVPVVPKRFVAHDYSLPQYVALFFNLDRKALQDQKLRLGLQLGTDKQRIADLLGESVIVDTPLLEIDTSDWRYQFDAEAAQGALFSSQWYFPEKMRLQRLLEQREANNVGPMRIDPIMLLDTGAIVTLTGSVQDVKGITGLKVNGVQLRPAAASGTWVVQLQTAGGTGFLKLGSNLVKLVDSKGTIIDSSYVWRTNDPQEFRRASDEQKLVEVFLASREGTIPEAARITAKDLVTDRRFLRRRRVDDSIGTRINDSGEALALTLLTSPSPERYRSIAEDVKHQWEMLGVRVTIVVPDTRQQFEERLLKRDYDILLFGQSLLDNLDSYPYWHSSGIQRVTGNRNDLRLDAYNLSQYRSFDADALLELIRKTKDDKERSEALGKLREVLKRDVPAVFLYSPVYTFAHRESILGVELDHLSLHSDRFLSLYRWYIEQDRQFRPGSSWMSFFGWLSSLFWKSSPSPTVLDPARQSGALLDH